MDRILCPIDFSDTARNAAMYAARYAQEHRSELILFHAHSIFDFSERELVRGEEMYLEAATERLADLSKEISQTFDISCYAEVEPTVQSISNVLSKKSEGYDLIIMGTEGPDDLYQFFTGSNTYNTSAKSSLPVLLVPSNCEYGAVTGIVYAFDYYHERKLPLAQLIPLARPLTSELIVLQVLEESGMETESELKEVQAKLQSHSNEMRLKFDTIRSSEIAQSIHNYMLHHEADMLALCTIHRNFLERLFHKSVIKHISAISNYPVFIFHQ